MDMTNTLLWNDTTREARMSSIEATLAAGGTVYVLTALRAIKVTAKTAAKWLESGKPVFKLSRGSLWVASGRRYDCIDYNHIQTEIA